MYYKYVKWIIYLFYLGAFIQQFRKKKILAEIPSLGHHYPYKIME